MVRELFSRCSLATKSVGQVYTIVTFDLGVIMKPMPIIWDKPDIYKNFIVLIGPFHTIMNYMNMIDKKMADSGYSDLLVEANMVTSGCLPGVLSGKKYAKALFCLYAVSEALERLLFQHWSESSWCVSDAEQWSGAISVARSMKPGCREEVDRTMEETFMKFAKSRGGKFCCL